MAEDGESPRIAKANELRQEVASGISRMRTNAGRNALGGPRDPRLRIEAGLEAANTQLTQVQRQFAGVSREPATQTPVGQRILESLASEVGHELSPPVTAALKQHRRL